MIFRLNKPLQFPDPALAEPDGLLAVGGNLSVKRLLLAYQNGIFPWYSDDTPFYGMRRISGLCCFLMNCMFQKYAEGA